jgi:peptidoglycan-associated lipoprotein
MTIAPAFRLRYSQSLFILTFLTLLFLAACAKKAPIPPPPPPPAATAAPPVGTGGQPVVIAEFLAEPSSVVRGQSAQLRWSVMNATAVSIDHGIGTIPASGTRRVTPDATVTYTLTASGVNGDVTRSATLTITAPAPPVAPSRTPPSNIGDLGTRVQSDLQDALFDYDSNNIRSDARTALTSDAEALKRIFADFPTAVIVVEGHCDERGSAEYNLGLGDRRASAARDFLVQMGVPADKLKTISYGKERPVCTESDESCWQRNRRAHFSVGQ